MEQQQLTARLFGCNAAQYLTSPVHSSGADLQRLERLAQQLKVVKALDLGCGAGHASFALARGGVSHLISYDLSEQMLGVVAAEAKARGHTQIEVHAGPAETLAFPDSIFDLVTTRFSAHHWLDMPQGIREATRVLKPGGTLIVIDVLAPEIPLLDTVLQTIEILRDLSHVRNYRESEWRATLANGFDAPEVHRWRLPMEFGSWIARIGTSAARIEALKVVFDELPTEARSYFAIDGDRNFAIDAGWLRARKLLP
jgi:ubiquinone/menaquinone biosynthesis C-methylase UbiE